MKNENFISHERCAVAFYKGVPFWKIDAEENGEVVLCAECHRKIHSFDAATNKGPIPFAENKELIH